MKSIEVCAGAHRYPVLIGAGLLPELGAFVRPRVRGDRCVLVADAKVAPLFGGTVEQSLRAAGFTVTSIEIAGGENAKSMSQAAALCEQMSAAGLDRTSFLVSLGGGVLSDLAGFAAAIFLRGIPYVSVPTTLLAQVDGCIGGKTGVNSSAGKNLIGSLHHPALVVADTDTLQTLPDRIWNEGFAEAIKHGIIRDAALFDMVAQASSLQLNEEPRCKLALPAFIARNLEIKAEIVAADEQEKNDLRALLNFGHTIGHAIEHAAGYGNLLHGEAISLGMVAAAQVSVRRAGLSLGEVEQIVAALQAHQLPVRLPAEFPREKIFAAIPRDKKFEQGQIRFVVAHALGRASVSTEVTMADIEAAIARL